jgi:hypothetical protein
MTNVETAQELFARALLAIEPEKIPGGSPARAAWLGLMLEIEEYLLKNKLGDEVFRATIEEG